MRFPLVGLVTLLVLPTAAKGGFNANYLVPGYAPCESGGSCASIPSSTYTFETAILKSPRGRFSLREGKVSVIIQLKGVRDASGQLVTTDPSDRDDRFVLVLPSGRIVLPSIGTLAEGSIPASRIPIELVNGRGKAKFVAEGTQPGLVNLSFEAPVVLDPDGNLFAATGAMAKP